MRNKRRSHDLACARDKPGAPLQEKGSIRKEVPLTNRNLKRAFLAPLIKLGVLVAVLFLLFTFVFGFHINHGNKMYPFLMDGDVVLTYKLDPYHAGDVVAYKTPNGNIQVSRIVAVGDSTIEITDVGALYIDGAIPSETVFYKTAPLEGSSITFPYELEEGQYFVLDDHRDIGNDSRAFGGIKKSDLLGKVVYLFRRRGI